MSLTELDWARLDSVGVYSPIRVNESLAARTVPVGKSMSVIGGDLNLQQVDRIGIPESTSVN